MKIFSGLKTRKLSKAIEKYPNIFKNYRDLITVYLSQDNFIEAQNVLQKALQLQWEQTESSWLSIQNLRLNINQNENTDSVITAALQVAGNPETKIELRLEAARVLSPLLVNDLEENQISDIRNVFNDVLKAAATLPESLDLAIDLASFEGRHGNPETAIRLFKTSLDKAVTQNRKSMGTLFFRGATLVSQLDKKHPDVKNWLIRSLDSGDLSDEETVDALARLADILRTEDDLLGAMERYETALRFAGSNRNRKLAILRFHLGQVYFQLGRIPQSEKELNESLADDQVTEDERAEILLWFAEAQQEQDHFQKAGEYAADALNHAKSDELRRQILKQQASIYEATDDFSAAVSALETACELQEDITLDLELARLYNLEGTHFKALKIVKQLEKDISRDIRIDAVLLEKANAFLGQAKTLRAIEEFLGVIKNAQVEDATFITARKQLNKLKKELQTSEGIKTHRIEGSDRKKLASLLAIIPDEEDLFTRLRNGLMKTRSGLIGGIEKILTGKSTIDEDVLDDIEELMILSDLGVETTEHIIDGLRDKLRKKELCDAEVIRNHIRTEIETILSGHSGQISFENKAKPHIILMVGVNGVGKTTTIAKIANRLQEEGKSLLLAAGDTFRAGAIEQLQEWGRRLDVDVIAGSEGSDPSAVAWDAVAAAKSRDVDVLIIDTAGRLHTKSNLMDELKKVYTVVGKNMEGAPHEVLLVLDATTGQNAVLQAREFSQVVDVSGMVLTKLDGTAKGGIIVSIVQEMDFPIKLIGIGERMDDLRDFHADEFARALFEQPGQGTGESVESD